MKTKDVGIYDNIVDDILLAFEVVQVKQTPQTPSQVSCLGRNLRIVITLLKQVTMLLWIWEGLDANNLTSSSNCNSLKITWKLNNPPKQIYFLFLINK